MQRMCFFSHIAGGRLLRLSALARDDAANALGSPSQSRLAPCQLSQRESLRECAGETLPGKKDRGNSNGNLLCELPPRAPREKPARQTPGGLDVIASGSASFETSYWGRITLRDGLRDHPSRRSRSNGPDLRRWYAAQRDGTSTNRSYPYEQSLRRRP